MPCECGLCGGVLEDPPPYVMWRAPEASTGRVLDVQHEGKSMCRTETQFFVRCDLVIPSADGDDEPRGFVLWIEVNRRDYERLLRFRECGAPRSLHGSRLGGKLANRVTGVPGSYGTDVRFEVVDGDPTPYVVWVAPGSALAARLQAGASADFWQELVRR